MKAETVYRFIRAIYNNNYLLAEKALQTLIAEEKQAKHTIFAKNLEGLLRLHKSKIAEENTIRHSNLVELPKNPKNNQELAQIIPHEKLRHHMILSNDIEKRFASIEEEFRARYKLSKHGLQPKKKILIYGPPGCGKTMGAERIAWNIGLPLIKVNFDSLISSLLGGTASNLRAIFDLSRRIPCVLLLDECDIIAKSRLLKQDVGEMSRIVNMLLLLLDEYNSDGLMIATTNLEETLDKAIYRRFDDIIAIQLPNSIQIEKLIKATLSKMGIGKGVDIKKLSNQFKGYSIASIVNLMESSMKIAILNNKSIVNLSDINQAIQNHYKIKL